MKILLINKFHYNRGGAETYYFAQAEALKAKGHTVIYFAMSDDKNLPCDQSKYFVPNVDYNNYSGVKSKVNSVLKFFYNTVAAQNMEKLIQDEHPDIAHVGLIHRQITFSVIEVLKKHHIPVVMTLHDLIFTCPNYTMLTKGKVCEKCLGGSVLNCIKNKCVKDSATKSVLAACEKRYLLNKNYYDLIDLYIAECSQYNALMNRSKFTKSRIVTKANFLPINQEYKFNRKYKDYILYFGRFSREKGIMTLLKAQKESNCNRKLILVGGGPIKDEIDIYIKDNNLTNVELPGPIYGKEMEAIIEGARTIIVPSEWYENGAYTVLQSLAKGKIVIASKIGGLPELIKDGETGFLFEAGNSLDLNRKIEKVFSMKKKDYEEMSELIIGEAYTKHGWEQYVDFLIHEYARLIG
jgi:glycosyltransferase involved in cell wall biosynthesis